MEGREGIAEGRWPEDNRSNWEADPGRACGEGRRHENPPRSCRAVMVVEVIGAHLGTMNVEQGEDSCF